MSLGLYILPETSDALASLLRLELTLRGGESSPHGAFVWSAPNGVGWRDTEKRILIQTPR